MKHYAIRLPVLVWLLLFSAAVCSGVAAEPEVVLQIQPGTVQDFTIPLSPDPFEDRSLVVRLLPNPWPGAPDLALAVVAPGETRRQGMPVGASLEGVLPFAQGGRTLWLRAQADACADPDAYEGTLEVWETAFAGRSPRRLHALPLRVKVGEEGIRCVAARSVPWMAGLVPLTLVLYMLGMCLNSTFISATELETRIKPVKKTNVDWGADETRHGTVQEAVRRDFGFRSRAVAWLKANPLIFGMPGQRYEESVELLIGNQGLSIAVRPERRLIKAAEEEAPSPQDGRLFVSATSGGVAFFGSTDRSGRVCNFRVEELNGWRWAGTKVLEPDESTYDTRRAEDHVRRGWKIVAPRGGSRP